MESKGKYKLESSKLAMISGWGTGIAVLFAFLNMDFEPGSIHFQMIDGILSIISTIFFLLIAISFASGFAAYKSNTEKKETNKTDYQSLFPGIFLAFLIMIAGWFFYGYVPTVWGATNTAATLGILLISCGFMIAYAGLIRLIEGGRNERA